MGFVVRAAVAIVGIILVAATAGWLFTPRDAFVPAGATQLRLDVRPGLPLPDLGCQTALAPPVIVTRADDEMVFQAEQGRVLVDLRWPPGWTARVVLGRAELVKPDLTVYAREGDVIRSSLGGGVGVDGVFSICSTDPIRMPPQNMSPKPDDPF